MATIPLRIYQPKHGIALYAHPRPDCKSMYLHYTGKQGIPPEYGSDEHLFLVACTQESPELWDFFSGMTEQDIQSIVWALRNLGWGFHFVTAH